MAAVWMRLRAEMRGRWRATGALTLVFALVCGGALAAAAGARRTHSAYPRFLERYGGFTVGIATGGHEDTDRIFRRIAELPMVTETSRSDLLNGQIVLSSGRRVAFPDAFLIGDSEGEFSASVKLLDGSFSDPVQVHEAMMAYGLAERLGIEPGDRVDVELIRGFGPQLEAERVRGLTITGTYAAVSQFETVTGTGFPTVMTLTPAFVDAYRPYLIPNEGQLAVTLRNAEADLPAFRRAIEERKIPYDSLTEASLFTPGVQRLNRIPETALWLLAAAIAVAGLSLVGQALSRDVRLALENDRTVLAGLGMSRAQLFAVAAIRVALVAVAGAASSIPIAIALSPLTPIGLGRIAEPDPGVAADWTALGVGALGLTMVLLLALSAWLARKTSTRADRPARRASAPEAVAGASVSAFTGIAMALEPGRGARAVPSRSAILSVALAVAALVAALGFDRSFARLQADPRLAGYVWDAAVITFEPGEYGPLIERIETLPEVEDAFRGTMFAGVSINGETVTAVAYEGYDGSVVSGRAPVTDDEVMLDGRTMRALGVGIGDRVTAGPPAFDTDERAPRVDMTVVGRFVVPRVPFQASENPEQGAFLTFGGLRAAYADTLYEAIYVRFRPDAGPDPVAVLRDETSDVAFAVLSRSSAATIRNVARLSDLPVILAGILGVLGAAAMIHALGTAVRRRRRDLAILKTVGFVGRQVRATVAWQATTLAAIGLLVGVPLGVLLGRWGWRLFAEQLDVVPSPVTSRVGVGAVVAGALILANVIAALPARAAARTQAAVVLRTE